MRFYVDTYDFDDKEMNSGNFDDYEKAKSVGYSELMRWEQACFFRISAIDAEGEDAILPNGETQYEGRLNDFHQGTPPVDTEFPRQSMVH